MLDGLPPELICHIFSYLDIVEQDKMKLVNQHLRNIVETNMGYINGCPNECFPHQVRHYVYSRHILDLYGRLVNTSPTGSGKTVVTILLARHYRLSLLVVCPTGVRAVWERESEKYGVHLIEAISYERFRGNKRMVSHDYLDRDGSEGYIFTDYTIELLCSGIMIVFDESQRIKNKDSITFKSCNYLANLAYGYKKSKVCLLSASPYDKPFFSESYCKVLGLLTESTLTTYNAGNNRHSFDGLYQIRDMAAMFDPETTERCMEDLIRHGKGVAESARYVSHLLLTKIFKHVYFSSMNRARKDFGPDEANGFYRLPPDDSMILTRGEAMLVSATSYNPDEDIINMQQGSIEKVVNALVVIESAKINTLARLVIETLDANPTSKVIVFINYPNKHLDQLLDRLDLIRDSIGVMFGTTSQQNRTRIIENFQRPDLHCRVIITSVRVGGVGLSLDDTDGGFPRYTFASPSYNFIDLYQACGRTFRSRTASTPTIRFVYSDSADNYGNRIELRVLDALARKTKTTRSLLDESSKVVFPGEFEPYYEIENDD